MKKFIILLCALACSSGALFAMRGAANECGFNKALGKWRQNIKKAVPTQKDAPEKFREKGEALIEAFNATKDLIDLLNDKTKAFDDEFKENSYDSMCKILIRTYKSTFEWLLSQGPYKQKNSLMLSKFKTLVDSFVLEADNVKDENGSVDPLRSLSIKRVMPQINCYKVPGAFTNLPQYQPTLQDAIIDVLAFYADENLEDLAHQTITEYFFEDYIIPNAKLLAVSKDMHKFDAKIARFYTTFLTAAIGKLSLNKADMDIIRKVLVAFSKALDQVSTQSFVVALDNDAFYISIDCKMIAKNIAPVELTEDFVEEELAKAMSLQSSVNPPVQEEPLIEEKEGASFEPEEAIVFNENDYPEVDEQPVASQEQGLIQEEVLSESEGGESEGGESEVEIVFDNSDEVVPQPINAHEEDAFDQQINNGLPQGGALLVRMQTFLANNWKWVVPVSVVGSIALAVTARYMLKRFFGVRMPIISYPPICGPRVIAKQPIQVVAAAA